MLRTCATPRPRSWIYSRGCSADSCWGLWVDANCLASASELKRAAKGLQEMFWLLLPWSVISLWLSTYSIQDFHLPGWTQTQQLRGNATRLQGFMTAATHDVGKYKWLFRLFSIIEALYKALEIPNLIDTTETLIHAMHAFTVTKRKQITNIIKHTKNCFEGAWHINTHRRFATFFFFAPEQTSSQNDWSGFNCNLNPNAFCSLEDTVST